MSHTGVVDVTRFAALAEPARLRIIGLLDAAPRPVGEVATALGLRQPQATKHLQVLERAGLVTVHPLGRRRIYSLRRQALAELSQWFAAFTQDHPSEPLLDEYHRAIQAEAALARHDPDWAVGRTLHLERRLDAPPTVVWAHWTSAELIRRWWSPEHFVVADCEVDAVADGHLRITIEEGDGGQHTATGRFLSVTAPEALRFELAALDPDGAPMFSALYDLRLVEQRQGTHLSLAIRITSCTPAAAPALAGLALGWEQLLERLADAR